jgi:hypothetical protein
VLVSVKRSSLLSVNADDINVLLNLSRKKNVFHIFSISEFCFVLVQNEAERPKIKWQDVKCFVVPDTSCLTLINIVS